MDNYTCVVGKNTFEQTLEDGKIYRVTCTDIKQFTYEPIHVEIESKEKRESKAPTAGGAPPTGITESPTENVSKEDIWEVEKDILNNTSSDHKLETALKKIEANHYEELKSYISSCHPDIKFSCKDTTSSLTDKLICYFYKTSSEKALKDTMERIRKIVNHQTPNGNSRASRFSNLRKVLKDRFGKNSNIVAYHKIMGGQTNEQFVENNINAKAIRDYKLSNRIEIDEKDALLIMDKMSSSDDVFDKIIALQLATGARFIEAVRVSSFSKVNYKDDWIHISGLAKIDGKEFEMNRPIFGLKSADEVIWLACQIRDQLYARYDKIYDLTNAEVSSLLLGPVNRRLKKLKLHGIESSHMLRKLYARLTYNSLPKATRNKMDLHLWINKVLGHTKLETAGNYANIKVNKTQSVPKEAQTRSVPKESEAPIRESESKAPTAGGAPIRESVVPEGIAPTKNESSAEGRIVVLTNRNGDKVEIHDIVPSSRGNAMARCEYLMQQLNANDILITEMILKLHFKIGSKTISNCSSLKRELNAKLKSIRAKQAN